LARGHVGKGYQRGLELGPGLGLGMREAIKVGVAPRAALALNYHSRVAGGSPRLRVTGEIRNPRGDREPES
jgi:hypothetical protein